jgi:hypothetical protein
MKRATTRARTAFHARLRRVTPLPSEQTPSAQALSDLPRRGRVDGRWLYAGVIAALLISAALMIARGYRDDDLIATIPSPRLIGATTTVTEVSTGLPFAARVDTGATTCSIHCEAVEIENADPDPMKNIGKPIRFLVKNKRGESKWVESKIVDRVTVRTAAQDEDRYKVRLNLRWADVEKRVGVTLDDRQKMRYPLLLGRNFLRDDFLVNVSLDGSH